MNLILLPVLFSFILLCSAARNHNVELTRAYLKELEDSNYDPRIAPDGNDGPGKPVWVGVSMYILDLFKVDDNNMDFEGQFYFRQYWNDSRLQHKGKGIESVILTSPDKIWTPDLFFVEEKEGSLHKYIHPNLFIRINPDGEVTFSMRLTMKFSCHMDLRNYPHDIQSCLINVESYGFTRKAIELDWMNPKKNCLLVADDLSQIEFDLIELKPSAEHVKFSFGEYSRLQIHLKLQRKIGFFIKRLYIPFILLVTLSWLSLWIRSEEKCLRLSLLLVIMYLMLHISHEVNEGIPSVSYTKASDVWIGFCESLVFAIFLEYIIVYLMLTKEDHSSYKGELLPTIESDKKEDNLSTNILKSPLSKFLNMMDARRGVRSPAFYVSYRIDFISRILIPIIFVFFNIVYWGVYCN